MSRIIVNAHIQMLGFTALLGGSFIASATISHSLPPLVITWLRYGIGSVFFIVLLISQGLLKRPGHNDIIRYLLISLPPLFYFICMIYSLLSTSAITSSAIYTLVPLLNMIMSFIFLRIKTSWSVLISLLIGIAGALLIIFKNDLSQIMAMSLSSSDYLFLVGCLGMALNPIVVKMLHRGEPALVMTGWSLICATLLLSLVVGKTLPQIAWREISAVTWCGVLYLATFATALSFFLFQKACVVLSPVKVSGYVYLIPLTVIATNALLGQAINWSEVACGSALVIVAVFMLIRSR